MDYEAVCVYDLEGEFLGFAIYMPEFRKFRVTQLYDDDSGDQGVEVTRLREDLERLNHGADMTAHWPEKDDPELVALLNDPEFVPIEYSEEWVVDDDAVQAMLDSGELVPERDLVEDPTSGNIEWLKPEKVPQVKAKVPTDPAAPAARMRKAAETIALRRMKADIDA